jgi:Tfp pilus assembly protein PilF
VNDAFGWVFVQKGLAAVGIPHLEAAVRTDTTVAVYRYHLGMAYARSGAAAKARAQLTRALELDPHLADRARAQAELARIR